MRLIDLIYYKLNKKAVDEGIKYIKRISVRKFSSVYIKRLTYKHDDFKIIKQLPECVDILSWRGNKKYLFRFHKADLVFFEDYENLINLSERFEVNKTFYLTSGRFEEKIYRNHRNLWMLTSFKMELLDCFHIVKKFLGFKRKWISLKDYNDYFDTFSP